MSLLTTPRVTASFGLLTFRLRFSVCHSSVTSLAADGAKCAFQALRWSLLHLSVFYEWFIIIVSFFSDLLASNAGSLLPITMEMVT